MLPEGPVLKQLIEFSPSDKYESLSFEFEVERNALAPVLHPAFPVPVHGSKRIRTERLYLALLGPPSVTEKVTKQTDVDTRNNTQVRPEPPASVLIYDVIVHIPVGPH